MAIHYNNTNIQHVHYNNTDVNRVYYNNKCVFGRLVEGVDYTVYQWLVGDGLAYIDTLIDSLQNAQGISCVFKAVISNENRLFGREGSNSVSVEGRCLANLINNTFRIWGSQNNSINFDSVRHNKSHNLSINLDANTVSIDGMIKECSFTRLNQYNFFVFAGNDKGRPSGLSAGVSFSKFEIINLLNLVPCRLLHSIPAALDANGIARSADESGFFDSVSGLFFGNVGSGAFSVENDS